MKARSGTAFAIAVMMWAGVCRAGEGGHMQLSSSAFGQNQAIPSAYTCDGANINPPLEIAGVPQGAQSLALIVDDPDAPMGTWVHWVVFNIPASTTAIEEDSVPGETGNTNFGDDRYGGPCPPSGTHRYFFKLYALDTRLSLPQGAKKQALEKAMQGHVLAKAELIGVYKRK